MGLTDPVLGVVPAMLGDPLPPALLAAAGAADGEMTQARVTGVTWWPGRSIIVRYQVEMSGGPLEGSHTFVAAAGRSPEGALIVEGDDHRVGVWRVPHDPALPGLASALDDNLVGRMLVDLGAAETPVTTRLRAYRPAHRAVVEARGEEHSVFLKVVPPDRVERLHRIHRSLAGTISIPTSLGVDHDLGIVALQSLGGETLRQALESPNMPLPPPGEVLAMTDLPDPASAHIVTSPLERLGPTATLIESITPELGSRLIRVTDRIGQEDRPADHPVHGDYYEAQLMILDGRVTGLLDVDTYGWGRPADDAATMLGHLSVWAVLSAHPDRVRRFGNQLLRMWDQVVDPVDLRLRAAAVVAALATGPFRVQTEAWPEETADRLVIAERWVDSASEVEGGFPPRQ